MACLCEYNVEGVRVAAAAPALANAAFLLAEGCVLKYAEALTLLYQSNNIPCPDMSRIDNVKQRLASMFQLPASTVVSDASNNEDHYFDANEEYFDSNEDFDSNEEEYFDSYEGEYFDSNKEEYFDSSDVIGINIENERNLQHIDDALPLDVVDIINIREEEPIIDENEWILLTILDPVPLSTVINNNSSQSNTALTTEVIEDDS